MLLIEVLYRDIGIFQTAFTQKLDYPEFIPASSF